MLRLLTLALIVVTFACNQPVAEKAADAAPKTAAADLKTAAQAITAERILEGTKILSADDMEGRAAGTAGERKAADWIAEQFKTAGLKPLNSDSFLQPVELVGSKRNADATLSLKGPKGEIETKIDETATWYSTSQKETIDIKDAEMVFVGYGVEAPEHNWDDYKGLDCTGKILVYLNNDPQTGKADEFGGEARTYYGRYTYKFEQAMQRGALGAIIIHTTPSAGYGWSVIGKTGSSEKFALKIPGTGSQLDFLAWFDENVSNELAKTVGSSLEEWEKIGNTRDFKPVPLPVKLSSSMQITIREAEAVNVVATWEGSDPELKNEHIVFSAHYDHLGVQDGTEDDAIYNGAWDNASGTVAIIEIAKAYAASGIRPKRSLTFVACTAEERGLLGSQWFVAKPPVAAKQMVGNINIDMPQIFGLTNDIVAIGHDTNSMGAELVKLAKTDGVTIVGDLNPNAGKFYRSDQVNFAKAGIPALYLNPGNDYVKELGFDPKDFHKDHYHQLNDEINEKWDLSGCERDMRLVFRLSHQIADAPEMPRWNVGNEFETAWKALHGK